MSFLSQSNHFCPKIIEVCSIIGVKIINGLPYFDSANDDADLFVKDDSNSKDNLSTRVLRLHENLIDNSIFVNELINELKDVLFVIEDKTIVHTIILMLCKPVQPISFATESQNNDTSILENPSILFGAPPSIFQILLSLKVMHTRVRDLIISLVYLKNEYALSMLQQFRRPFGLKYMFSEIELLQDSCSKLINLLLKNDDLEIQLEILLLLPEVVCPSVYSGMLFNDSKPFNLVPDLLELLNRLCDKKDIKCELLSALISCILNLGISEQDIQAVETIIFKLLESSTSTPEHLNFASLALKLILTSGARSTDPSSLARNVKHFRARLRFPSNCASDSINNSLTEFIKRLSIAIQFNQKLTSEWLRCISSPSDSEDSELKTLNNEQALQDFLGLILLYCSSISFGRPPDASISTLERSIPFFSHLPTNKQENEKSIISAMNKLLCTNLCLAKKTLLLYSDLIFHETVFPTFLHLIASNLHTLVSRGSPSKIRSIWLEIQAEIIVHTLKLPSNSHIKKYFSEMLSHLIYFCSMELSILPRTFPSGCYKENFLEPLDVLLKLAMTCHTPLFQLSNFTSFLSSVQDTISIAYPPITNLRKIYTAFAAISIPHKFRNVARLYECLQQHLKRMLLVFGQNSSSCASSQKQGTSVSSEGILLKPTGLLICSILIEWFVRTKISIPESQQPLKKPRTAAPFRNSQSSRSSQNLSQSDSVFARPKPMNQSQIPNLSQRADYLTSDLLASQAIFVENDENIHNFCDSRSISMCPNDGSNNVTATTNSTVSRFSLCGIAGTSLASDHSQVWDIIDDIVADEQEILSFAEQGLGPFKLEPGTAKPQRPVRELAGLAENAVSMRSYFKLSTGERVTEKPTLAQQQLLGLWLFFLSSALNRVYEWVLLNIKLTNREDLQLSEAKLLILWYSKRLSNDFENQFVIDYDFWTKASEKSKFFFGLHDSVSCPVAISFYSAWKKNDDMNKSVRESTEDDSQLSEKSVKTLKRIYTPQIVPQILQIIATGEMTRNGNLFGINALFGCPLLLPSDLKNMPLEYFLSITNWFISLCCIFSRQIVHNDSFNSNLPKVTKKHDSSKLQSEMDPNLKRDLISVLRSTLVARLNTIAYTRELIRCKIHLISAESFSQSTTSMVNIPKSLNSLFLPCLITDPMFATQDQAGRDGSFIELTLWKLPNASSANTKKLKGKNLKRVGKKKKKNKENEVGESDILETVIDEHDEEKNSDCDEYSQDITFEAGKSNFGSLKPRRKNRTIQMLFTMPELEPCFMELELSVLVCGLRISSLSEFSPVGSLALVPDSKLIDPDKCESIDSLNDLIMLSSKRLEMTTIAKPQVPSDHELNRHIINPDGSSAIRLEWITGLYLLNDLRSKLDFLHNVSNRFCPSKTFGWNGFEKFSSLEENCRNALLSQMLPGVVKIMNILFRHFANKKPLIRSQIPAQNQEDCCVGSNKYDFSILSETQIISLIILHRLVTALPSLPEEAVTFPPLKKTKTNKNVIDKFAYENLSKVPGPVNPNEISKNPILVRHKDLMDASRWDYSASKDSIEFSPNWKLIQSKAEALLNWLMSLFPSGLATISVAYLHCQLVHHISEIIKTSKFKIVKEFRIETNPLIPDLNLYTKTILNTEFSHETYTFENLTQSYCISQIINFHIQASTWILEVPHEVSESSLEAKERQIVLLGMRHDRLAELLQNQIIPALKKHIKITEILEENLTTTGDQLFKCLNKETLPIIFRAVLDGLQAHSGHLASLSVNTSTRVSHGLVLLKNWTDLMSWLSTCSNFLVPDQEMTFSILNNLNVHLISILMLSGRVCLDNMIKRGTSLFNEMFSSQGVEVTSCFKSTQSLTRFLQRVCIHAKTHKTIPQITAQIPKVRLSLESFVYKVKAIMSNNQCGKAFWLGNLKNKDLHGLEVLEDENSSVTESPHGIRRPVRPQGNSETSDTDPEGEEDLSSLSSGEYSVGY